MFFGCIAFFTVSSAQSGADGSNTTQVTVKVGNTPGYHIPTDFTGISFEVDAIIAGHRGVDGYFFRPSNIQLVNLFKNSGLRSLRIGGSTVDRFHDKAHNRQSIDSLFAFAKTLGIKIIYSLPLLNAAAEPSAATAKYIAKNYGDLLECFSIGNEPNCLPYKEAKQGAIFTYEEYLPQWRKIAAAVIASVPDAKFTGPDAGGWNWTEEFARDEVATGRILFITHHQYPGGKPLINSGKNPMPADTAIRNMLSKDLLTGQYSFIWSKADAKVHPYGLRCRLTEANDYLGGIAGASNALSSALWALDYMQWQAERGLAGINFHNNQWLKTCTVYMDEEGNYLANPKALAIRAFDMLSGGYVMPVFVSDEANINLTAYAVKHPDYLYVTVINKEYGASARNVRIIVSAPDITFTGGEAKSLFLQAPEVGSTSGVTLGGDSITNFREWKGKWVDCQMIDNKDVIVIVPKSSAVIIRIPTSIFHADGVQSARKKVLI